MKRLLPIPGLEPASCGFGALLSYSLGSIKYEPDDHFPENVEICFGLFGQFLLLEKVLVAFSVLTSLERTITGIDT